jgi:hypothetical protein
VPRPTSNGDANSDVRVLRSGADGRVDVDWLAGSGFLIGPRHVATCAHVVAEALGGSGQWRTIRQTPEEEIELCFTQASGAPVTRARIVHWPPAAKTELTQADDLAILELSHGSVPSGVSPAPLARPFDGDEVYGGGISVDAPFGKLIAGRVGVKQAEELWVLQGLDRDASVMRGCSGTALWSRAQKGVVGMVVARQEEMAGVFIGAGALIAAAPDMVGAGENGLYEREQRYLRRALQSWIEGAVDEADRRTSFSDGLFSFQAHLYLRLAAIQPQLQINGRLWAEVREDSTDSWLLRGARHPILLIGEAGGGKTTTIAAAAAAHAASWGKEFAKRAARVRRDAVAFPPDCRRMPVVLRAPDLISPGTAFSVDDLKSALGARVLGCSINDPKAMHYAMQRLTELNFAIYIDGIDELARINDGRAILNAAAELCDALQSDNDAALPLIVLTTRPSRINGLDCVRVYLQPVNPIQVSEFVHQFAQGDPEHLARLSAKVAGVLRGELGENFLSTPLLLNAFCALEEGFGDDAKNRIELLDKAITYLVGNCVHGLSADHPLDGRALRQILQTVAAGAHEYGLSQELIGASEVKALVRDALKALGHDNSASAVDMALGLLAERTGIIERRFDGDGDLKWRFRLATFREYLAAETLVQRWRSDRWLPEPRKVGVWKVSMPLAAALIAADDEDEAHAFVACLFESVERGGGVARIDWVQTIADSLHECRPSGIELDDPTRSAHKLLVRLIALVRSVTADLASPVDRDRLLCRLYAFGRRQTEALTAEAVETTLDIALAPRSRWVNFATISADQAFSIADISIPVASYAAFLEAEAAGQIPDECWSHAPAFARVARDRMGDPAFRSQLDSLAAPATGVTWFEAVAHARWLTFTGRRSGALGQSESIRLPTAPQWQALAFHFAQGRRYPWGSDELPSGEDARVNWLLDAGLDWPSIPGVFAPYGTASLHDFGATVRCWLVTDRAGGVTWPPRLEPDENPKVIGGSWACPEQNFRANSVGRHVDPSARDSCIGYRFVKMPSASPTL